MQIPRALTNVVRTINARTFGFDIDRFRGTLNRFPNDVGEVCLTFDDGPSGFATMEILDVLERFDVRATFFCTGRNAQRHPEVLTRMVGLGHEVGSHSMTHPNFNLAPLTLVYREMRECRRVLESIGHCRVRAFRAPHGRFGWEVRPIGRLVGTPYMIGWDVSPHHEWVDARQMADEIVRNTTSSIPPERRTPTGVPTSTSGMSTVTSSPATSS